MTESVSAVKLLPLDSAEAIELVAGCLGKYDNYKWLDFGNGVQRLTPVALRVMTQRALHEFRIYTAAGGGGRPHQRRPELQDCFDLGRARQQTIRGLYAAGMLGAADVGIQRTGAR